MLKKTITYNDLDNNEVTEDFYFNLTMAELTKMQLTAEGGMEAYLTKVIQSNSGADIIKAFDEILGMAYGRRSEDGKTFVKKPEYYEQFKGTEAYSQLFMELVTDADASARFMGGLVPANLAAQVRASIKTTHPGNAEGFLSSEDFGHDVEAKDYSKLTAAELRTLPQHELVEAYRQKNQVPIAPKDYTAMTPAELADLPQEELIQALIERENAK